MTCPVIFMSYLRFIPLFSDFDQKSKFKNQIERTLEHDDKPQSIYS